MKINQIIRFFIISTILMLGYHAVIGGNLNAGDRKNALYWAENYFYKYQDFDSFLIFAENLYNNQEYERVISLINSHKFMSEKLYLLKALSLVNTIFNYKYEVKKITLLIELFEDNSKTILKDEESAKENALLALHSNISNFESFKLLINNAYLDEHEIENLFDRLKDLKTSLYDKQIILADYKGYIRHYNTNGPLILYNDNNNIKDTNYNHIWMKAIQSYNVYDFSTCLKFVDKMLKLDKFNTNHLTLYINCLFQTSNLIDLMKLCNEFSTMHVSHVSLYALACYYRLQEKFVAIKYLHQSTALDKTFGPSWILLGHIYHYLSEPNQALTAYYQALKHNPNCHMAHLYVGSEYSLTQNHRVALEYVLKASQLYPNDPVILHELAYVAYQCEMYDIAWEYFNACLELLTTTHQQNSIYGNDKKSEMDKGDNTSDIKSQTHDTDLLLSLLNPYWEPLFTNMGNLALTMKKYETALDYFLKAQRLSPQTSDFYMSLGITYGLLNKPHLAIDAFNEGLALNGEHIQCKEMLDFVINEMSDAICSSE